MTHCVRTGVSDAASSIDLKDVDGLTWSVQAHKGLVELHFHSETAALMLGVIVAVADGTDENVLLQCWASKQLVFPEVKPNGRSASLPGRHSCFNGVRAVNAAEAPRQTVTITNLPRTRSECVPVTLSLQASTFAPSRIFPLGLRKRIQTLAAPSAGLCVGIALALLKLQKDTKTLPR